MNLSPLQLRHYHFTAISLKSREVEVALPGSDELYPDMSALGLEPEVSLADGGDADPHEFVVKLKVEYIAEETSSFPYEFTVEAEGLFFIEDAADDLDERKRLVVVNGAGMLLGAMREQLLSLSARHRYGPILLPSFDFRRLGQAAQVAAGTPTP